MADKFVIHTSPVVDLREARERITELEAQVEMLREAVSGMNPNNPFSVIEVQILVEGER